MTPLLTIGMTTAPRADPTVSRAVSSLREAGFSEPIHLFAEPGAEIPPGVIAHRNATRLGVVGNFKAALEALLARSSAPWILLVQDDVIWAQGSAAIVAQALRAPPPERKPVGFFSPYTSLASLHPTRRSLRHAPGWVSTAGGRFWGACAVCLPRVTAERLLAHPRFRDDRVNRYLDALLDASMRDLERPIYVYRPSLCDHIGATSTVSSDRDGKRSAVEEQMRRGFAADTQPPSAPPRTIWSRGNA